ncbi:M1 family metallopeptidase [Nonomuraea sp. NPDC049158]|uniref:M1 family metallopeptidase n=1 Tax=Nonomuraea sp. NPDC049158 TaxID=3155649 RepID=UPI0033C40B9A
MTYYRGAVHSIISLLLTAAVAVPGVPDKGLSEPVADPVYPAYGNPAIDVLHYGLKLDWKPSKRLLTGTARLTVRAVKKIDKISLDFGRALRVDGVTVAGKTVKARHPGDHLVIPLRSSVAAGKRVEVAVRYHGVPQPVNTGQYRPDTSKLGLRSAADGSAWALQEPYGAFTWFPVNDHPSDEARYDVAVTVPRGWAAVAHGRFEGRKGNTYLWRSTESVASYVTLLTVDRYQRFDAKGPRGIPITYWLRRGDQKKYLPVVRQTPAILRWLEKRLGPYPFNSAGVVATSDSGMETQQMVTLAPEFLTANVVAHEMAHQWFGDAVTPRTWRDVWLNEGFAMYFEWAWQADHGGSKLESYLRDARALDGRLRNQFGPPGHYQASAFGASNVYYGPAVMLHEIRKRLGDERFFATLRAWVQEHKGTTQDRASFVKWLNERTGDDFTALVDDWLDSPTTPTAQ